MVERKKAEGFDEFEGMVKKITIEKSKQSRDSEVEIEQYHIEIEALNKEIKGKTGLIHTWIKISPKTTPTAVTEDSVLDKYIRQLELLDSAVKKFETHIECINWMKEKKFVFKLAKLGKAYDGHEATEYWLPAKIL